MTNPDPRNARAEELERLTDELRTLKMSITDATVRSRELASELEKERQQEAELRQKFEKTQAEISSLSILRLGKKMAARNTCDALTKQLTASMQHQVTLTQRQEDCRERLAELTAKLPALEAAVRGLRHEPADQQDEAVPAQEPAAPAVQAPAAPRKARTPRLRVSQTGEAQLLAQLEALYPQRQIFAADSVCPRLMEQLHALANQTGCDSAAAFLERRGWQMLSSTEARLRRTISPPAPGEEPEIIRPRLTRLLARLEKHYPDRIISRSLQQEHKGLAQDVSGLALYLGYPDAAAMLTAYGFAYHAASGRPVTESDQVLDALSAAVAGKSRPHTVTQLLAEHPEFARQIKTLQNQAPARFGCTLRQHLLNIGVLAPKGEG